MSKNTRKLPLTEEQLLESDRLKALFEGKKKELGLTQEKIAAELGDGVTQGAVSHFLNRRTALNLEAAVVFARLLKVPVAEFSERLAADLDRLRDGLFAKQCHSAHPYCASSYILSSIKSKTPLSGRLQRQRGRHPETCP